jgi:hypothetical protein
LKVDLVPRRPDCTETLGPGGSGGTAGLTGVLMPAVSYLGFLSALGGTRIPNLLIRSQMLCPIELRAHAPTSSYPRLAAHSSGPVEGHNSGEHDLKVPATEVLSVRMAAQGGYGRALDPAGEDELFHHVPPRCA